MSEMLITNSLYLVVLVALSIPLGNYIAKVMTGQQVFLSRLILPAEQMVYRLMGIRGRR
jgi:K+-transporting ATPase, A chain